MNFERPRHQAMLCMLCCARPSGVEQLKAAMQAERWRGAKGAAPWLGAKCQLQRELAWLLDGPYLELPPVGMLLQHCLSSTLKLRVSSAGSICLCKLSCG